jgi:hypothetical protein
MNQQLLHVLASPDRLEQLSAALQEDGFAVVWGLGGVYVRVRVDSGDESRVQDVVRWTAPSASFDVPASPAMDLVGYRDGL